MLIALSPRLCHRYRALYHPLLPEISRDSLLYVTTGVLRLPLTSRVGTGEARMLSRHLQYSEPGGCLITERSPIRCRLVFIRDA